MELIRKYFPELSSTQLSQFEELQEQYEYWNERINVISRKDIDNLYEHHILHSLAIAKVIEFVPGTKILDIGTGGGFPGIPLAILFPETQFHLVDSIGKKIKVVVEISDAIGLSNVTAEHARAEEIHGRFDFIVSRAVTSLDKLSHWSKAMIEVRSMHSLKNGLLVLKGGDISAELETLKYATTIYKLSDFFKQDFFSTKFLVHVGI